MFGAGPFSTLPFSTLPASAAVAPPLFRVGNFDGVGSGGPFFSNPTGATMKFQFLVASTSQTINVFIADSSSTTGAGLTGLVYNSSGLGAAYALPRAAAIAVTLATQTVAGGYSSGGFVEIDATRMPGWYRLDLPDAALASGRFVSIHLKGATNMAPLPIEIELTAWNNQDAIHGGLSSLPNTACTTNASLLTSGTGTDQLSVTTGRIDIGKALGTAVTLDANSVLNVSTKYLGGTLQTARDVGLSVLLSSGTGTGQLDFTSGVVKANATQWLGGTIPAVNVTGVPLVDAKYLLGTVFPTPTVAGIPNVNAKTWNDLTTVALPLIPTTAGRTLDVSATGEAGVDWANVGSPTTSLALTGTTIAATQHVIVDSGTVTTLTNLPAITAGWLTATGIAADAITDAKVASDVTIASVTGAVGSVTGAVGSVTGAVGSVTGNVGGNVTGSIGSVTAGGITAASLAADCITAAKIADSAIDTATFAAGTTLPRVTLVDTTTTNTDMRGTDSAALAATALSTVTWTGTLATNLGTLAGHDPGATIGTSTLTQTQVTGGAYSVQSASCVLGDARVAHLNADIDSRMATYTQPAGFLAATFPGTIASTTNITAASGVALTVAYDPAKTASQAGDAMALTSGERTTLTATIWAALTSGLTTAGSIGKRLVDFMTTLAYSVPPSAAAIRAEIDSNSVGLAAIYADTHTSLPATLTTIAGYIDTEVGAIKAKTDNLPSDPADASDITAEFASLQSHGDAIWSSSSSLTAAQVWTYGDRTLTSGAGIVTDGDTQILTVLAGSGITFELTSTIPPDSEDFSLIKGDDYLAVDGNRDLRWNLTTGLTYADGKIKFIIYKGVSEAEGEDATVIATQTTVTGGYLVRVGVTRDVTRPLTLGEHRWELKGEPASGNTITLRSGIITMTE